MKRMYIVVLLAMTLLTGCKNTEAPMETVPPTIISEVQGTTASNQVEIHPTPPQSVSVNSVDELSAMRDAVNTKNTNELKAYAASLGLESEQMILDFLDILDSLPDVKLIDGEICYISYQIHTVFEQDDDGNYNNTTKNVERMYISTVAPNGNWVRLGYWLNQSEEAIEDAVKNSDWKDYLLEKPTVSKDGRITVYCERRRAGSTTEGVRIDWLANIDGYMVNIVYFVDNADTITAHSVFSSFSIS